jgi:hypothetical protein
MQLRSWAFCQYFRMESEKKLWPDGFWNQLETLGSHCCNPYGGDLAANQGRFFRPEWDFLSLEFGSNQELSVLWHVKFGLYCRFKCSGVSLVIFLYGLKCLQSVRSFNTTDTQSRRLRFSKLLDL